MLLVVLFGMAVQLALRLVLVGGPIWLLLRHLLRKTKAPVWLRVWLPVLLAVLLTECAFGLLRHDPIILCPEEDRAVFDQYHRQTVLDRAPGGLDFGTLVAIRARSISETSVTAEYYYFFDLTRTCRIFGPGHFSGGWTESVFDASPPIIE